MENFILPYESTYLVYGNVHSGKTTLVRELLNYLDEENKYPRYFITSSFEDYCRELTENSVINDDYDPNEINEWISENQGTKILVLDDFLHICTETGKNARHIKSIITTTRKQDKKLIIIISTHLLSIGKFIRTCASCFIFLKIDEDAKKICKQFLPFKSGEIDFISKIILRKKFSFLIFNITGEYSILKLKQIESEESSSSSEEEISQ